MAKLEDKERLKEEILSHIRHKNAQRYQRNTYIFRFIFVVLSAGIIATYCTVLKEERCIFEVDLLFWEFSRPITKCDYCIHSEPLVLHNVTRESFQKYAYSSKVIIIKGAINHWSAKDHITYDSIKDLYERTYGSSENIEESRQFLNFQSDLQSLRDMFNMSKERVANLKGEIPWYIGWEICHPEILADIQKYYSIPEFLPEDIELPKCDNIFIGYENGALEHLDFITRLMWQGQVLGHKIWRLSPVPECENQCQPFEFIVDPGDALFLDTRIWYHATQIPKGEFSLTIQSEYG